MKHQVSHILAQDMCMRIRKHKVSQIPAQDMCEQPTYSETQSFANPRTIYVLCNKRQRILKHKVSQMRAQDMCCVPDGLAMAYAERT